MKTKQHSIWGMVAVFLLGSFFYGCSHQEPYQPAQENQYYEDETINLPPEKPFNEAVAEKAMEEGSSSGTYPAMDRIKDEKSTETTVSMEMMEPEEPMVTAETEVDIEEPDYPETDMEETETTVLENPETEMEEPEVIVLENAETVIMVDADSQADTSEMSEPEPSPSPTVPVKSVATKKGASPPAYTQSDTHFRSLHFSPNVWEIHPAAHKHLDGIAEHMKRFPSTKLEVYGNADYMEPSAQELSEKRAKAVINYLISKGIDTKRFALITYGATNPKMSNLSPTGQAANRRVDFRINF